MTDDMELVEIDGTRAWRARGKRRPTRAERKRSVFREFQRYSEDRVPDEWTPEHVGARLRDAYETLRRMPDRNRPKAHGQGWPSYVYEWADLLAQQETEAAEREADERQQNRVRLPVSAGAVSRMEDALSWPGRYLGHDPALARLVMLVAIAQARRVSIKAFCKRQGWNDATVRRRRNHGLALIADALAGLGVEVR